MHVHAGSICFTIHFPGASPESMSNDPAGKDVSASSGSLLNQVGGRHFNPRLAKRWSRFRLVIVGPICNPADFVTASEEGLASPKVAKEECIECNGKNLPEKTPSFGDRDECIKQDRTKH